MEGSFDFLVSIFLACFGDELAPAYLKLQFPAYLKLFANRERGTKGRRYLCRSDSCKVCTR